jgi:hypothetical protein
MGEARVIWQHGAAMRFVTDQQGQPVAIQPPDFATSDFRIRAEGSVCERVIWPAAIPEGTEFVLTNDRMDQVIARGSAHVDHVTVRFEPHELKKGYYYRIRPVLPALGLPTVIARAREGHGMLPAIVADLEAGLSALDRMWGAQGCTLEDQQAMARLRQALRTLLGPME